MELAEKGGVSMVDRSGRLHRGAVQSSVSGQVASQQRTNWDETSGKTKRTPVANLV